MRELNGGSQPIRDVDRWGQARKALPLAVRWKINSALKLGGEESTFQDFGYRFKDSTKSPNAFVNFS